MGSVSVSKVGLAVSPAYVGLGEGVRLYIADSGNELVRVVTLPSVGAPAGSPATIATFAGGGVPDRDGHELATGKF